MEALLAGPNALETDIGWGTSIPADTELLDINIRDGIAIVDLSAEFEQGSGTLAEVMRVAQVVFTLTQFDSVSAVSFRIEGEDSPSAGLTRHRRLEPRGPWRFPGGPPVRTA